MRLTSFGGLLQVTVDTHTGETEDRGLNHLGGLSVLWMILLFWKMLL